jgi:hypothetical protein
MDNEKAITLIHQLECESNYWRIEAQSDHARWLRALEELEKYRWQPIETAPFDTMILALYHRGLIGTIVLDSGYEKPSTITHWTSIPSLPKSK